MDRIIFRVEAFEAYGLNKYRNFLGEGTFNLDTNDELFEFMLGILGRATCENCVIFAIDWYGGMWAGIKTENDENMELIGKEYFDINYFAMLDCEYRFCCYALIIETRPGVWKAVTK